LKREKAIVLEIPYNTHIRHRDRKIKRMSVAFIRDASSKERKELQG